MVRQRRQRMQTADQGLLEAAPLAARRGWARSVGFTLLELAAVLVLLAVLAIVAVNRFSNTNDAQVEADALRAALRYAQARAMADVYTWGITVTADGYALVGGNNADARAILPGTGGAGRTMPDGVTLTPNLQAGNAVYFDWRGQPVTSSITAPGNTAPLADASQTITLTQNGKGIVVTILPYTGFVP